MILNFCTLFNSAYLSRGLTLYDSLKDSCKQFHLYVFAFDTECYDYLKSLNLRDLTVISLNEFEDEELLRIKPSRTSGEYCWTCTASTIRYAIKTFNLHQCTYIDADMFFYSDPKVLIDEMGSDSVLITEHRYTKAYDQSEVSGKYCVQFMTFNNDERGMKVLEWWRNACIDWCYARVEDGKFGDQKYLDTWTKQFEGVHELKHLGGGLAPWNMQQYKFERNNGKLIGTEITSGKQFEGVFFHFHGLKLFSDNIVSYTGETYEMDKNSIEQLFEPYVHKLLQKGSEIAARGSKMNYHAVFGESPKKPMNVLSLLRWYLYDIRTSLANINGRKTKRRVKHHHYFYIGKK